MPTSESPRKLIVWTIAMVVLAGLLLWAAFLVRGVLLLIYVSVLFAIGFSPLVRIIERQNLLPVGSRRFPRWLAILLIYVAIIGTVVAVGSMIVPPLVRQARELWSALPGMLDRSQQFLIDRGLIDHPITLREAFQQVPASGGDAVGTVFQAISGVAGGLFGIFTILILTFYLLIEAEPLFRTFLRFFPHERRAQISNASREITFKVSAWLTGQLLLGGIIATTAAIGLWLIGVPYFYVLAVIAGIGELIPVVGPLLAAIPAVAVAASVSLQKALVVAIFFVVQQQFENHLLVPKIMERQVGVSAVMVIVALLIGGSLLGIVGAILAVPTAAILQVIVQELTPDEGQSDR
jgi:predicted PurR-regulated permease PerM